MDDLKPLSEELAALEARLTGNGDAQPTRRSRSKSTTASTHDSNLEYDPGVARLVHERQREKYLNRESLAEKRERMAFACGHCGETVGPKRHDLDLGQLGKRTVFSAGTCDCDAAVNARRREREREKWSEALEEFRRFKRQLRSLYHASGLPEAGLMAKLFINFDQSRQPEAYDAVCDFARLCKGRQALVLHSDGYGVGKTHLSAAVLHYVIRRRRVGCRFYHAATLWGRIRDTYGGWDNEGELAIYHEAINAPLIVLDDVGRGHSWTEASEDFYYRIIDGRYSANRPIIVTTNVSWNELGDCIGWAAFSRLSEMVERGTKVEMPGDDFRLKRAKAEEGTS